MMPRMVASRSRTTATTGATSSRDLFIAVLTVLALGGGVAVAQSTSQTPPDAGAEATPPAGGTGDEKKGDGNASGEAPEGTPESDSADEKSSAEAKDRAEREEIERWRARRDGHRD